MPQNTGPYLVGGAVLLGGGESQEGLGWWGGADHELHFCEEVVGSPQGGFSLEHVGVVAVVLVDGDEGLFGGDVVVFRGGAGWVLGLL